MDHQAIVETVFKAVVTALPTELGALLGQELSCSDASCRLATKTDLFNGDPRPKSTLSHLNVTGDHEGKAFLVLSVKTAIIFGGTLIMLPQDQIDENVNSESLEGEVADAYGEVANILAGVMTQIFLDKYSKSIRFVRTEVDEFNDTQVDVASEQPFPPGNYFHLSTELNMGGQSLGLLEVITPVDLLDIEMAEAVAETTDTAPSKAETAGAPAVATAEAVEKAVDPPSAPKPPPFADAKKVADVVLKATVGQVTEEVGALLGQNFTSNDLKLEMVTKEEFFSNHCFDKSTLTHITVSGDVEGEIYLLNQTKDAILMGGTLIMLPEEEIQSLSGTGGFDGEVADAYGEVVNIISGGLTQTFLDRYPRQLRFVKTTAETIVPIKIIPADDSPFPDGLYYMASFGTKLQDNPLGKLFILFPAEILGLESYGVESEQPATEITATESSTVVETTTDQGSTQTPPAAQPQPLSDATPVLLVIADTQEDAEAISRNLSSESCDVKVIGFKDDIRTVFSTHPVLGVFLLMSEVGEKGFSVAIKLQSSGYKLPPVIAGGPEWTRSSVLKAIKYGARDILITPASDDEIREKANQHIAIPA